MSTAFPNSRRSAAEVGALVMLSQERSTKATIEEVPIKNALPLLQVVWPFEFDPAEKANSCLPLILSKGAYLLTPSSNPAEAMDLVEGLLS